MLSKIDTTTPLRETVKKPYTHQIFVCAGDGKGWPERIEEDSNVSKVGKGNVMRLVAEAVRRSETDVNGMIMENKDPKMKGMKKRRVVVTATDYIPTGPSEGSERIETVLKTELLLFPHFASVKGVGLDLNDELHELLVSAESTTPSQLERIKVLEEEYVSQLSTFFQTWLTTSSELLFTGGGDVSTTSATSPKDAPPPTSALSSFPFQPSSLPPETQACVFICTHLKRDKRCGVIGPMLMDEFQRVLEEKGLDQGKVLVMGGSHWGGHKFAGNVIVSRENNCGFPS
jgi:hypothetical protein